MTKIFFGATVSVSGRSISLRCKDIVLSGGIFPLSVDIGQTVVVVGVGE